MDKTVYISSYFGVLLWAAISYWILNRPTVMSVSDTLFGITLVLFVDKIIANPFWRKK